MKEGELIARDQHFGKEAKALQMDENFVGQLQIKWAHTRPAMRKGDEIVDRGLTMLKLKDLLLNSILFLDHSLS